jgi:hypothetical protein
MGSLGMYVCMFVRVYVCTYVIFMSVYECNVYVYRYNHL